MEEIKELDVIKELLETKQYTRLRQKMSDMNTADIAFVMEELEEGEILKIFRILPKSMAADVFSYLEVDSQQFIITSLSEREAANIIDNLNKPAPVRIREGISTISLDIRRIRPAVL